MPPPAARPDAARWLYLAALIIEAARDRPGASWTQLVRDAGRLHYRATGQTADPAEFDPLSGVTLAQLTAPR